MTAAIIFGLLGVIVGGVLNYVAAQRLDLRKERGAARAAARLLMAPAESAASEIDFAISASKWWPVRYVALRDVETAWNDHRQILASQPLSLEDWQALLKGFDAILAVYRGAREMVETSEGDRASAGLDDFWAKILGEHLVLIREAMDVLRRLAADGR